jgi:hypothetical protein
MACTRTSCARPGADYIGTGPEAAGSDPDGQRRRMTETASSGAETLRDPRCRTCRARQSGEFFSTRAPGHVSSSAQYLAANAQYSCGIATSGYMPRPRGQRLTSAASELPPSR